MQGQAGGAREDQQLAANVLAGQVDPRIWLGVAGIARLAYEIRERPLAVVAVEQPDQRTRQHALDAVDEGAAGDQPASSAKQTQPRRQDTTTSGEVDGPQW